MKQRFPGRRISARCLPGILPAQKLFCDVLRRAQPGHSRGFIYALFHGVVYDLRIIGKGSFPFLSWQASQQPGEPP